MSDSPRRTLIVGWGLVALIVGALWLVVRAERSGGEDQSIIRAAEVALAQGKAYRQKLQVLRDIAARAQGLATVAIAADRAKDGALRQLRTRLAVDSTVRDSVVTLLKIVDTLTVQLDTARFAIGQLLVRVAADSAARALAEQRADSLEAHLRRVLTVADCRMLGLSFGPRCLSRTTSAVIGAVAGVAAAKAF